MNGLFDVFDEKPSAAPSSKPSKKRLANGQVKTDDGQDSSDDQSSNGANTPTDVKRRKSHRSVTSDQASDASNSDQSEASSSQGSISDSDGMEDQQPTAAAPSSELRHLSQNTVDKAQENGEADDDQPSNPQDRSAEAQAQSRVADAFETEESREIAGASGLQAQTESAAVVLSHQVRHQVSLPLDYDYVPISKHEAPETPAKTWPFRLDPFQQVAIASVERNESVLVSAHTSAGKTVCAEYAIAQCLKNNQRVVYTSPIKALSNQKYREFNEEFGDVGLMTGDVTINPTATCLVMTTEILRSMLYRGSEVMREVAWVVFDEVHYLRDKTRGVVWEETIILLPDKVRYVFLSATIPNAMQFAEWITKTHSQPCHVVYTDFRPVPLQHYLFPAGADGIHLVVDEKGVFREENFSRAMTSIAEKQGDNSNDPMAKRKGRGKDKRLNKGGQKGNSDIYKIIKMIMQKAYNPVIVFSFSKRECENFALQMSQLAFNDDSEKDMVEKVFNGAVDMLSEEDKQLPQIQHLLPLLKRGIGIHHSGLLPILKETIEILFQEGLIKVLFATETFSIGLNMPAKTVMFTSVRKFDGVSTRWVTPSEFIQMSGRSGRRGIDERGIVIMMIDEKMEPSVAKEIVRGEQDKLNSAFHLGYNMILNLLRVEGISPEFMLERCFYQFQGTASVSGLEKDMHQLEAEKASMRIKDEETIKEYWDLRKQLDVYASNVKEIINLPNYALPYMQPGRLIKIRHMDFDFGWGVVVNFRKRYPHRSQLPGMKQQELYVIDALLHLAEDSASSGTGLSSDLPPGVKPPAPGTQGRMEVVPIILSCVDSIATVRLHLPKDLRNTDERQSVLRSVQEVKRRFPPQGIPLLDPIEDMHIRDEGFKNLLRKIEVLESRLFKNPLHDSPRLPELYNQYAQKNELQNKIKSLKKQINAAMSVMQLDELKSRKRVLRRLNFINDAEVVQLKARVACEISTGDELVISELMFNRFFNDMTPQQCAAVLSCFIFEEKSENRSGLREELATAYQEIQRQAKMVAKVSQESKLAINEEEYLGSFKPELMEVVYAWAHGASFAHICKMTDVYEGSLIRLFRRLEELLRQIAQGAKAMGSEDLEKKFEESLGKIRRDIVASQSLYL